MKQRAGPRSKRSVGTRRLRGETMDPIELQLIVVDEELITAVASGGQVRKAEIKQDPLDRQMMKIFEEDWLVNKCGENKKISSRRELQVYGTLLYRMLFVGKVGELFE